MLLLIDVFLQAPKKKKPAATPTGGRGRGRPSVAGRNKKKETESEEDDDAESDPETDGSDVCTNWFILYYLGLYHDSHSTRIRSRR